MRRIEKLLRKIGKPDRERLISVLEKLISGESKGLEIRKISNSDLYHLRSGRFRIIFHYDDGEPVVDAIRMRSEKTYKRL